MVQNAVSSADTCHATSHILPYTSPARVQAVAWLHGVKCIAPEKARVLELGCEAGSNLLPFAMAYPESESVGIDLDNQQIAVGQETLKRLAVCNIQLVTLDLGALLKCELGMFDYIIVHGVFGLVSGDARTALLGFCQRHLSPQGVVCVNYTTYPGGKVTELLQDALNLHAGLAETAEQQHESAKAMLTYLSLGSSASNPLQNALRQQIAVAEQQSGVELALHYLQGLNQPCYFLDFNAMATEAGLSYVGDIQPHTEIAKHYGNNVANMHEVIADTSNRIIKQQYLDFAVARSSRFSLLVSQERENEILSEPDWTRLTDFYWAGSYLPFHTEEGSSTNGWIPTSGGVVTTDHQLTQRVLNSLGESWPIAQSFEQLLFNTREVEMPDKDESVHLQQTLLALFIQGLESLHFRLGECVYKKAKATTLQLIPCVLTETLGFNFWHEATSFIPSEQQAVALREWDIWSARENDQFFTLMSNLHRQGLLQGSPLAWQRYFQQAIVNAPDLKSIMPYLGALVFYASDPAMGGVYQPPVISSRPSVKAVDIPAHTLEEITQLIANGDFIKARATAESLTQKDPENIENWNLLGDTLRRTGEIEGACRAWSQILRRYLFSWSVYYDFATQSWEKGFKRYTLNLARKIIRCDPGNAQTWNLLTVIHLSYYNLEQAEFCCKKAYNLQPNDISILNSMAAVYESWSLQDEANSYYRRIIELSPHASHLHSNLLFGLNHSSTTTPEALFLEHREFGIRTEERMASLLQQMPVCQIDKNPQRKLRIGFVSGDLGQHPVTNFLEPVWNAIDRNCFALYAYATSALNDDLTQKLKNSATGWHVVRALSDIELARLIQQDKIDILFDLAGHTAYNRLPMFALKPAPIQISWIGYPGTSGLKAMDYYMNINHAYQPDIYDHQFVEKVLYVPFTRQFQPIPNSPPVNELPAIKNGYFTFASFNRPKKINREVLSAWSKILTALPDSKMIIGALSGQEVIESIRNQLESLGVRPEQLVFRGRVNMVKYLAMHQEIDLLLDTFPYTGGTTTNHALWMGVPTLTIAGATLATRQGVATLNAAGLDAFIGSSVEDYIQRSLYWAEHLEELATIRAALRPRLAVDRTDGVSPATYFERALRIVWQRYCAGEPAVSFAIESDE